MQRSHPLALAFAVVLWAAAPASAQSLLDRKVGTWNGQPLVLTELNGLPLAQLAAASDVPMGVESAPPPARDLPAIVATGRTLRNVLDAIVSADPRYAWRENGGVVVIRPRDAWDTFGPLDAPIEALKLEQIDAGDALATLARLVGTSYPPGNGTGDTLRFSVDVPDGTRYLDLLNAIVRAHGRLMWRIEYSTTSLSTFPMQLLLFTGNQGSGFGIPAGAYVRPTPGDENRLAMARSERQSRARIVGPRRDGEPLAMNGVWGMASLSDLGAAVGLPTGLEVLSSAPVSDPPIRSPEPVTMSGLPLEHALTALGALDPRYEWREMNGVIVYRPVAAWYDAQHPLAAPASNVKLERITANRAIALIATLLGAPQHTGSNFPDTRRFSVDMPAGTILDLLNAVARSHGALSWMWEELDAEERKSRGYRFRLSFTPGNGSGWGYYIP